MANILVIDDDANLGCALQMALTEEGHTCRIAETAEQGWAECQRQPPDLALLDMKLPDTDGLELLVRIHEHGYQWPVILMTAFGTVTTAVTAMKRGAADFIEKPLSIKEVCQLVRQMLKGSQAARRLAEPNGSGDEVDETRIIADCQAMRDALAMADRIAQLPIQAPMGLNATLILGETGTGKELLARYIHNRSPFRKGPFIHVNCTAVPETLFEAEHFGFEPGTFTDAKSRKKGLIEVADEGTLFLDEVADMPLSLQGKLLVAIESGRFRRLGSTTEQKVNMRVIAATNRDLAAYVEAGKFRGDLYHRLKLFSVELPPLRHRGDDVDRLADHFVTRFSRELDQPRPHLPEATRALMRQYRWPGNVRELAHVLLRVMVIRPDNAILPEHLDLDFPQAGSAPAGDAELKIDLSSGNWTLASVERKLLETALSRAGGNIAEAARIVGMPRGTFRYRLEKLGLLDVPEADKPADE